MLDQKQVNHVAKLSKLGLTKHESKKFSHQLTEILSFVQEYSSLDTKSVEPSFGAGEQKNVFREDEVKPSLSQKEALANASSTFKGFFKVKAIFEE